jgi:hypothetical protein
MQREELSGSRNRQAAETREVQNEDQIWQRWAPATGPPAVRQRRGSAGGVPAQRIPRVKPPGLARRGEIATNTQKLRLALSCEPPLPNHVLPLAHFGAISDVCDGGVVRTDHHNAGERSGRTQHYDLKVHHAPVGGW